MAAGHFYGPDIYFKRTEVCHFYRYALLGQNNTEKNQFNLLTWYLFQGIKQAETCHFHGHALLGQNNKEQEQVIFMALISSQLKNQEETLVIFMALMSVPRKKLKHVNIMAKLFWLKQQGTEAGQHWGPALYSNKITEEGCL